MNNDDTISRAALLETMKSAIDDAPLYIRATVDQMITEAPSVPPQVVHGRWIKVGADKYCSCCSAWKPKIKHHITNETIEPICCPSCGAKMDGGEDDADN